MRFALLFSALLSITSALAAQDKQGENAPPAPVAEKNAPPAPEPPVVKDVKPADAPPAPESAPEKKPEVSVKVDPPKKEALPEAKKTDEKKSEAKPPKKDEKKPEPKKPEPKKEEKKPDDKSKTTITDLTKVDADYAFQGEYSGGGWGLQVVAFGGGKFEASLYEGGLPGEGGTRQTRSTLKGTIENGYITLRGDYRTVLVAESYAELFDINGNLIAHMGERLRQSPTMYAPAPANATVLFDGTNTDHFQNGKMNAEKLLQIGTSTKMPVGDFRMHLEFRTPYMPFAKGQSRGNSGVYIQTRYELQILDSFGLEGVENECGGMYRQHKPDLNMALPPLVWQTYDIWFRAARFAADGKTKISNANITVLHNGTAIHTNYELPTKTGAGKPESPDRLPIALQDHGNPVTFRNIWLVPMDPIASPISGEYVDVPWMPGVSQPVFLEPNCCRCRR